MNSKYIVFVVTLIIFNAIPSIVTESCTPSTCKNNAECENVFDSFICHCADKTKGDRCQYSLNPGEDLCLSNPCWGGGICTNVGHDYICDCPTGRIGKNCKTVEFSPCAPSNPCQNNGICDEVIQDGVLTPICFCTADWTGKFCETLIPCSDTKPCKNNGKCINNVCQCLQNFTGPMCEIYRPFNADKFIKITNLGWYVAEMRVYYSLLVGQNRTLVWQTGSIVYGQNYGFYIPYTVDYNLGTGCILWIHAMAGNDVMNIRITDNPACYHIYGTTLDTGYTQVVC